MRALVHEGHVPAAELTLADVPLPGAQPGRVQVRVLAASPNPVDWHLYQGAPRVMRLLRGKGLRRRGWQGVGEDFSGVVDEVGAGVTGFEPGQRAFGTLPATAQRGGSMAQLVSTRADWITPLPDAVSPTDAAAVPLAGLTALQALRDSGGLRAGSRVLVWGSAGGVGHLAVQIAHLLGAGRVDAVCSTRSAEMVRGLGADTVFDYTRNQEPTGPYDIVIDTVCTAGIPTLRRILSPNGTVVTIGAVGGGRLLGPGGPLIRRGIGAALTRLRARTVLTDVKATDLALLGDWLADGSLRVVVQEIFDLDHAREAYQVLEAGRVRGKLVVRVADEDAGTTEAGASGGADAEAGAPVDGSSDDHDGGCA
ncbi:NAD(P)-dependent alcohol dehydrogenase [Actinomyces provencensis]|uniref:NAD(P)-dependent alcohol dehydrogenase n=1 Tax=Actinomyces provencensis TaxID=1720198 RepID=UPI001E484D88|nr:NAD(P)-dependent alcohol dehydrogenase [Actinomyces provencensis]